MIGAVLDTNVLVSGLLTPFGKPAAILNAVRQRRFMLYYSMEIINEYLTVLSRPKFNFTKATIDEQIVTFTLIGIKKTVIASTFSLVDESDRPFYDLARSTGSFLVTGNIKHFPVLPFIVTPADFLEMNF